MGFNFEPFLKPNLVRVVISSRFDLPPIVWYVNVSSNFDVNCKPLKTRGFNFELECKLKRCRFGYQAVFETKQRVGFDFEPFLKPNHV